MKVISGVEVPEHQLQEFLEAAATIKRIVTSQLDEDVWTFVKTGEVEFAGLKFFMPAR